MRAELRAWLVSGLLVAFAPLAHAQSEDYEDRPAQRFEVTPFVGYRGGGAFDLEGSSEDADVDDHVSFAIALDVRADSRSQYELFWSRQNTRVDAPAPAGADLRVDYVQFGGVLVVKEDTRRVVPYIVGTAGIARLALDAPDAGDETRFAISFAAGMRMPLRPRLDLRFEARGYMTFLTDDTSVFCGSDVGGAACGLRGNDSTFTQYEVLAGAAYRF